MAREGGGSDSAPPPIVQLVLPAPRPYHLTPSDLRLIEDYYRKTPPERFDLDVLAAIIGRHKTNICRAARRLGLTRQGRAHQPAAAVQAAAKQSKTIQERGHPRGFLGGTHSPRTRSVLSTKSIEMWKRAKATNTGVYSPENRQRYSDALAQRRATQPETNPYSRARGGIRPDIGPMYFRSSWEANYARYLNWLKSRGDIEDWKYEPETFWFEKIRRGVRSYKPDFRITEKGHVYYVEVKGWMDDKSKTKLARMKRYHPKIEIRLVTERDYRAIKTMLSRIIEGWE